MKLSSYCSHDLKMCIFYGGHARLIFMPPTSKKLRAHIGLGLSVRQSICPSVRLSVSLWQLRNSRTAYARILKLYMWHVHEKLMDLYFFFPPPVLSLWSYAPFLTMYEQPCEQNILRTAKATILIFGI